MPKEVDAFFKFFDLDHDENISQHELRTAFVMTLDHDGNYFVSPKEFFLGTV